MENSFTNCMIYDSMTGDLIPINEFEEVVLGGKSNENELFNDVDNNSD